MWKEWFYFSRGERRVILLLLLVFIVTAILVKMESSSVSPVTIDNNTKALTDSLIVKIRKSEKRFKSNSFTASRKSGQNSPYEKDWNRRVANAERETGYSSEGPVYNKSVYRKSDNEKPLADESQISKSVYGKSRYIKQEKFPEGTIIDINTADTVTLKKIPGIGSVISRNIVRYRDRLGGFYSIDQILEVRYADSILLEWFETGKGVFRKLKVNTDELEVLKRHPYMGYYRAKAIIDYRTRRGKIKSLSQISFLKEFSGKDLEKLKHYLDFE